VPGGVQRPFWQGAVDTQSLNPVQVLPAGNRAAQTLAAHRCVSHSELLTQVAPTIFFARHTRVPSQYASGRHWKLGHDWPGPGSVAHRLLVHIARLPQSNDDVQLVPGAGSG
jgi:hypothetical protein